MSQINELKREIQESKKLRFALAHAAADGCHWYANVISVPCLRGRIERVWPFMITTGVLGIVIRFEWKLRRQTWFWVTMAVITVLHLLWVLFVPWTTKWIPVFVYIGIATADFVLILWILLLVEKFVGPQKTYER